MLVIGAALMLISLTVASDVVLLFMVVVVAVVGVKVKITTLSNKS